MIQQIPNVLSPEFCDMMIRYHKELKPFGEDNKEDYRYEDARTDMMVDAHPELRPLLSKMLIPYLKNYLAHFDLAIDDTFFEVSDYCAFENSAGQPDHFDNFVIRKDGMSVRPVVLLAYLNDNFSDGLLIFKNQGEIVYPERGKVVLFPSSFIYAHYVTQASAPRYVMKVEMKVKKDLSYFF